MNTVTLYHGNNGAHEFYETERGKRPHLCIIRHYDGAPWFVLSGPATCVNIVAAPLSAVIREAAAILGRTIEINPHIEYRDDGASAHMVLEAIA